MVLVPGLYQSASNCVHSFKQKMVSKIIVCLELRSKSLQQLDTVEEIRLEDVKRLDAGRYYGIFLVDLSIESSTSKETELK